MSKFTISTFPFMQKFPPLSRRESSWKSAIDLMARNTSAAKANKAYHHVIEHISARKVKRCGGWDSLGTLFSSLSRN